jgi:hypothetical protein
MSGSTGSERLVWIEPFVDEICARLDCRRPNVVVAERRYLGRLTGTQVARTDLTGKSSDLPELTIPPCDLEVLPEEELRFAVARALVVYAQLDMRLHGPDLRWPTIFAVPSAIMIIGATRGWVAWWVAVLVTLIGSAASMAVMVRTTPVRAIQFWLEALRMTGDIDAATSYLRYIGDRSPRWYPAFLKRAESKSRDRSIAKLRIEFSALSGGQPGDAEPV